MKKLFIILLVITAVGCAKKYTKPAEKTFTDKAMIQEDIITPEETDVVEEEVYEDFVVPEEEEVMESSLSIDEQAKAIFRDVLFDYDKYDIRPDARPVLNSVAAFLNDNKGVNIVLEGHCDDRGTNEYNLALGEKRAKAAKNYLSTLGVSPARMIVITFGEEKPLCYEQEDTCWQQNRRAHFVIVKSRFQ